MKIKLSNISMVLVIFVFSLSLAILGTIVFSPCLYALLIKPFNFEAMTGLSYQQVLETYQEMIVYLVNPLKVQLDLQYFGSSESGLQHFMEVKQLVMMNYIILGFFTGLMIYVMHKIRTRRLNQIIYSYLNILHLFPLLLLSVILVSFDKLFIIFHQILFNNDMWLFNPLYDPVILILPESIFMILFILALLIYVMITLAIRLWIRIGR